MPAIGTQPIVGIEWFNLQCKAVVSGKFIIFTGWRGSATYPTYVKCRSVKPKAPPNRLSNSLFIRKCHIAGIATNILHRVDIETKKEHNSLI